MGRKKIGIIKKKNKRGQKAKKNRIANIYESSNWRRKKYGEDKEAKKIRNYKKNLINLIEKDEKNWITKRK